MYTSRNVVSFLESILSCYKNKFKSTYRIVRGDSGFAYKELYYLCETLDTQYVIRLKANPNLYRKAAEVTELVMREENIQY